MGVFWCKPLTFSQLLLWLPRAINHQHFEEINDTIRNINSLWPLTSPRIKAELTGREMHIESYGLEHHTELRPDKWVILKDQMLQCQMPLSLPMITNTIFFFFQFLKMLTISDDKISLNDVHTLTFPNSKFTPFIPKQFHHKMNLPQAHFYHKLVNIFHFLTIEATLNGLTCEKLLLALISEDSCGRGLFKYFTLWTWLRLRDLCGLIK